MAVPDIRLLRRLVPEAPTVLKSAASDLIAAAKLSEHAWRIRAHLMGELDPIGSGHSTPGLERILVDMEVLAPSH